MSLICPDCTRATLEVARSIVLPPDSRSDDILLQLVECAQCSFQGVAVYEESRRGRLDSESWEHTGYRVSDGDLARLSSLISRCPDNRGKRCRCRTHQELGRADEGGRWQAPDFLDRQKSFPMRLKR